MCKVYYTIFSFFEQGKSTQGFPSVLLLRLTYWYVHILCMWYYFGLHHVLQDKIRYIYCNVFICTLNLWFLNVLKGKLDAINVDKAVEFVLSCMNFDGGFGCRPGSESHAGQVGVLCNIYCRIE